MSEIWRQGMAERGERRVCNNIEFHPNLCNCLPRGFKMITCDICAAMVRERDMEKHVHWHDTQNRRISHGERAAAWTIPLAGSQ
jgi:hypothetical protein